VKPLLGVKREKWEDEEDEDEDWGDEEDEWDDEDFDEEW
jgi:hypothetical protein